MQITKMSRAEKYLNLLFKLKKQLLDQREKDFDLKDFIKHSRIDNHFMQACLKIGLVIKYKKNGIDRYVWEASDPTIEDAKFVIELVNDFCKKIQGKEYADFNNIILNKVKK